eukprot:2885294-Karenia_brevis.AAC.1
MKAIRKILGVTTTFVDRSNKNTKLYDDMQGELHKETLIGKKEKIIKPFSEVYEDQKTKLLQKIIGAPPADPSRHCTFRANTIIPIQIEDQAGVKRRHGRPRVRWVETGLDRIWKIIGLTRTDLRYATMNLENEEHVKAIEKTVKDQQYEITPGSRIKS